MGYAIELRRFDRATLRRLARTTKNGNQSRRLLAWLILRWWQSGGQMRPGSGGCGRPADNVRDWVVRLPMPVPGGVMMARAPGQRPKLD